SGFPGQQPVEMFGGVEFPPVGEGEYFITLGPHAFYWFTMRRVKAHLGALPEEPADVPELVVGSRWTDLFEPPGRGQLEEVLPSYLQSKRWFGGKARRLKSAAIEEIVPMRYGQDLAVLMTVRCEYA